MLHRVRHALAQIIARLPVVSLPAPAPVLALPAPEADPDRRRLEDHLSIPVVEFTEDDRTCRRIQDRGQFLARQDRWRELSEEIRAADLAREKTSGGMPVAELLAYGARSDVIHAVEHALIDGRPSEDAPLIDGIMGLEAVRGEHRGDPYISLLVALAHIDIAWAWRGTGWDTIVPRFNRGRCAAHFDRAKALLAPFSSAEMDSPLVAGAQCALLTGRKQPARRVADDYEQLIRLDPGNHRHMRAFGNHLLPRWFGSHQDLELEARRAAALTQDIWGNGAYAWVCFDAIAIDEEACARVDVEFFIDGLRDIAERRPEQEMINLLAAYCAVALRNGLGMSQEADLPRMQIADCANWLIRDHLTELHPMIWAHAADGFDNNTRITSPSRFAARGRADALQVIADLFHDEITGGRRVTFTANGPQVDAAG